MAVARSSSGGVAIPGEGAESDVHEYLLGVKHSTVGAYSASYGMEYVITNI